MNIGKSLLSVFGGAIPNLLAGNGLGAMGSMSPLMQLLHRGGKKGGGKGPIAAQLNPALPPEPMNPAGVGNPGGSVYQPPAMGMPSAMPNMKPAGGMFGTAPDRQHAMALALLRMGQQYNGGGNSY